MCHNSYVWVIELKLFLSSVHEKTHDACYSLNLNGHLVPIISMRRSTQAWFFIKISKCRDPLKLIWNRSNTLRRGTFFKRKWLTVLALQFSQRNILLPFLNWLFYLFLKSFQVPPWWALWEFPIIIIFIDLK